MHEHFDNESCLLPFMTQEEFKEAMQESVLHNPENASLEATHLGTYPPEWAPLPEEKNDMSAELVMLNGVKWRDGFNLRIRIMDADPALKKKIQNYIRDWDPFVNLRLTFSEDADAEIRISIGGSSAQSQAGTLALGIKDTRLPTMTLKITSASPEWLIARRVRHEFGHALGAMHEHQSAYSPFDWDEAAVRAMVKADLLAIKPTVTAAEIEAYAQKNFLRRYDHSNSAATEFDPLSIMLYPIDPKLTTNKTGAVPPTNVVLSDKDKAFMRKMYPKKTGASITIGGKMGGWLNSGVTLYKVSRPA